MEKKINLKNPVHFLAVGFGSGLLKPAPGTWGTLAGLMLSILLWNIAQSNLFFIFLAVISFIFGCYLCQKTSNDIVAIFLMFAFLPEYNWLTYILTFISFRIFDILKPYPIRYFDEKLESGLGIMVDDILAAIFALISLYIIYWIM